MSQTFDPIQPLQELTDPLPLRSVNNPGEFNDTVEKTLQELQASLVQLNDDFIPKTNTAVESVNPILAELPAVVAVGKNIPAVNTVSGSIANVNTVAANVADVNAVAANIVNVRTTGQNITAVNTAAENIDAIIAAPAAASSAAASATVADQSAQASVQSATDADASAQDAAASALTASQSATNAAGSAAISLGAQQAVTQMEAHVEQMHDSLVEGASPEALPETPILRDTNARAQIADPAAPLDIVNKQSMESAINVAIASVAGGLKTPKPLDLESKLPPIATAQTGDYYVVADMDTTAPGYQGRAWCNKDVSTTAWQTVIDRTQSPDGDSIVYDAQGRLAVSDAIQQAVGNVDTGGSVTAAIAAAIASSGGDVASLLNSFTVGSPTAYSEGGTPAVTTAAVTAAYSHACVCPQDGSLWLLLRVTVNPPWVLIRVGFNNGLPQVTGYWRSSGSANPASFSNMRTFGGQLCVPNPTTAYMVFKGSSDIWQCPLVFSGNSGTLTFGTSVNLSSFSGMALTQLYSYVSPSGKFMAANAGSGSQYYISNTSSWGSGSATAMYAFGTLPNAGTRGMMGIADIDSITDWFAGFLDGETATPTLLGTILETTGYTNMMISGGAYYFQSSTRPRTFALDPAGVGMANSGRNLGNYLATIPSVGANGLQGWYFPIGKRTGLSFHCMLNAAADVAQTAVNADRTANGKLEIANKWLPSPPLNSNRLHPLGYVPGVGFMLVDVGVAPYQLYRMPVIFE